MSGEYRDDQNITIEATDNPELAKRYGLTQFDKATGQYRRPQAPDAGERDGDAQRYREALTLADEQHEAERARLEEELADAKRLIEEAKAGTKATGSKASGSK